MDPLAVALDHVAAHHVAHDAAVRDDGLAASAAGPGTDLGHDVESATPSTALTAGRMAASALRSAFEEAPIGMAVTTITGVVLHYN